tara:strand:+ start:84 stop:503 length:420 start_codon:yes stop_codon:yes gene_type:complete
MKEKSKILKKINTQSFNTLLTALGIEITDIGNNFVKGKMPVDHKTKQPFGVLHGGASVALAETLGSIGGGLQVNQKTHGVVGIEINASHLKSIKTGWVYGEAKAIRVGRKIHVWEIFINDKKRNIICKSRLTLAVITKK